MEHIARVLGKSKSARACVSTEQFARSGWKLAVGKRLAARAQAVALVRSRLVVAVEDADWQRQLHSLESQILSSLVEVLGPGVVTDLEFRVLPRRMEPRSEHVTGGGLPLFDEREQVVDPILSRVYRASRKKASL